MHSGFIPLEVALLLLHRRYQLKEGGDGMFIAIVLFYTKSYCNALCIGRGGGGGGEEEEEEEEGDDNCSWLSVELTYGEIHAIWCMV